MFYWLFTKGAQFLSAFIAPLLCLTFILPMITVGALGAGIRRVGDQQPIALNRSKRTLLFFSYSAVALATTAIYLTMFSRLAIKPARGQYTNVVLHLIVGAPTNVNSSRLLLFGSFWLFILTMVITGLHGGIRNGGWLHEHIDRLRTPNLKRGALGSSHFCSMREFRRFRRPDPEGLNLLGAFWGESKRRLDFGVGQFCLGGEDVARGILALGSPGSGKTQGIILPAIADRMALGHSLIIADPQGELTEHVLRYAAVTRHLVVVHDPTSATGPRYNVSERIENVSDARAIADVLVPAAQGDNKFWTDSAAALLAACLIRFPNLGEIYNAMNDLKELAKTLASKKDDAALLANSFIASAKTDAKVASNIVATLATALTGWASTDVRANTAVSDFDAELVIQQPTVVVLTCPGRMRAVYASYLGATLRKLMLDLDTIGERNKGPLPMPIAIVLDEFPTLGKLDGLVADVNLVRKRRISILIGAQTKGQFHLIYGSEGTQALFTGLATQVVYGGCDADTAEFYSKASGTATTDANIDDPNSQLRQRPLLTVDEVITPNIGNCTIFARYVEPGFATQVILNARLTRFYEREDWKQLLESTESIEPLLLVRSIGLVTDVAEEENKAAPVTNVPITSNTSSIERAARARLAEIHDRTQRTAGKRVKLSTLEDLRVQRQMHKSEIKT
ncbi:MAG: type IV secretory system conjugative DNA transfer family protein [Chloroflexota bacterium]